MLQRGRMAAKGSRPRPPYANFAEMLFRLGEIAAIGFFVFAAMKGAQGGVKLDDRLDVMAFIMAGLMCFIVGWSVRRILTGNSDLS